MENSSVVLFLNCGHVCCCPGCSSGVELCPLCRATIVAKIKLNLPLEPSGGVVNPDACTNHASDAQWAAVSHGALAAENTPQEHFV